MYHGFSNGYANTQTTHTNMNWLIVRLNIHALFGLSYICLTFYFRSDDPGRPMFSYVTVRM